MVSIGDKTWVNNKPSVIITLEELFTIYLNKGLDINLSLTNIFSDIF
ncbi:hypothetical protein COO91_08324 [Nostoc flagelliforme CCNUN1]|uniref:Uncharacterized protein n=1 Tax=Nostoc flagelliforme CCNUN1 TaxID=2038116 RepID=A0A2K8T3D4_9NOSO|nr:hypothetical protein COO91_08324 [Nostoc flagelliforme CCNUN1]